MNIEKNERKSIMAILFTAIIILSAFAMIPMVARAAEGTFYMYGDWNLGAQGNDYLTGINGYIDTGGLIEGIQGAEYIIFTGSSSGYCGDHYAYIYRVDTAGDPNMHHDNPAAPPGPIATRTFTPVGTPHYMDNYCSGHDNAFYIDDTGIYYGASPGYGGIRHWDFDWNVMGWEVSTPAPAGAQTLARNPYTGEWWTGLANRKLYKWGGSSWVYQFTHPNLAGDHHDGMEIVGNSLFVSDMTSDEIIQYRLDESGNAIDPPGTPYNTFTYATPAYRNVECMGYGPNRHIWVSGWNSYTIYELGGGLLGLSLIPDQCIFTGEAFESFDLDDYAVGTPPFTWTYSGNVNLDVNIGAENVVTVTYPEGWTGSETITFTVTDSFGITAAGDATFTVCPVPVVGDIRDQTAPFEPFDLDDHLSGIDLALVIWSASEPCEGWTVDTDEDNVVTVTAPEGATEPCTITFTATTYCCGREASDSDDATFKVLWHEINKELDALIETVSAADMPNIIKQRLIDKLEYAKELKENAKEECEAGNFDGATKKLGVAKSQVESFESMVRITRRIKPADKASFLEKSAEIKWKIDTLIDYIETENGC